MIKLFYIIFFLSLCITSLLPAQVTQEWVQRYNGPGNTEDVAFAIAVDRLGNVYVTGWSIGSGTGLDYATIKYNSAGVQQWVARYNGPGNGDDYALSLAVDKLSNVYVTGYSTGNGTNYDYATIKYNSNGDSLWIRRYNGPGNGEDDADFLAIDTSGNVYVTGRSTGSGTGFDYATIKYNSLGVEQWVRRYNVPGTADDEAYWIALDSLGNLYVTGSSVGSSTNWDYATIKYNSNGDSLWVKRYDGPVNGVDVASSVICDRLGNICVTGYSTGSGTNYDYATMKYDSAGNQLWVKRYNGSGNNDDRTYQIAVDGNNNIFVTGRSTGSGTGYDYTTIKYNTNGDSLWVAKYNGPGNAADIACSIAIDRFGNSYVTGWSAGSGTNLDYASVKYNSSGVQQWVQRYNGPSVTGSDVGRAIAVDSLGNVYVTGYSNLVYGGYNDYATIKYSQPTGIQIISNNTPESFSLYQNYPNPFNPTTKIKFDIPNEGQRLVVDKRLVQLKIFDILGREVATLVNEKQSPGTYEVTWNASAFSNGVYFYRLTAGDYSQTRKLILLK
ncbi:MAG TPA: SBBP repeat-containing protein [Ignavibacteria bacterium]